MPLVFVHGVTVRKGPEYNQNLAERDGLFRRVLLAGADEKPYAGRIFNSYWGDSGVTFRWNQASLPPEENVSLGAGDKRLTAFLAESPPPAGATEETILADMAQDSLARAIDLLWSVASNQDLSGARRDELSDFARRAADYAAKNKKPDWLKAGLTNDVFVEKLVDQLKNWKPQMAPFRVRGDPDSGHSESGGPTSPPPKKPSTTPTTPGPTTTPPAGGSDSGFQSLGFNDTLNSLLESADQLKKSVTGWVSGKATQLKEKTGHWISTQAVERTRSSLHPMIATFVGDIFIYLNERGDDDAPGPIVNAVMTDLLAAFALRTAADPLILVGHSLGGVILYDLLTSFLPKKQSNFQADAFITVGSQVALFEEMKLYRKSDKAIQSPQRVPRPPMAGRWLNVYDKTDLFSFFAGKVFDGVEDYAFSSETDVLSSHSAYFLRPTFYERLRARMS
jgi:hypothetical protein